MMQQQYIFEIPNKPLEPMKFVDGDTADVLISKGLRSYRYERVRILNIDAPETRGEERPDGLLSTLACEMLWFGECTLITKLKLKKIVGNDRLVELLDEQIYPLASLIRDPNAEAFIETRKQGKYGRYLAEIYYRCLEHDPDASEIKLNDLLVEKGFAEWKEY